MLQDYSGFYAENPKLFNSSWSEGDQYPIREDLKITTLVLNYYYMYDSTLSLRAAFKFSEKQKKTAHSFMYFLSANLIEIDSDSSLIPPSKESKFGEYKGLTGGLFTTISFLPGYGITYVFLDDFYISAMGFLGFGLQGQIFKVDSGDKTTLEVTLKSNIRFSAGFNSEHFYGGAFVFMDIVKYATETVDMSSTSTNILITAGYRF